jgi:hypothetical protein
VGTVLGALMIAGGVSLFRRAKRYEREEWPLLKAKWDRSYACQRCARVFEWSPG